MVEQRNASFHVVPGGFQPGGYGAAQSNGLPQGLRITVRSDNGGDTISEKEKRERGVIQADIMALERDSDLMKGLQHMEGLASNGSEVSRAAMCSSVEGTMEGPLRRLLYIVQ